MKTIFRVIRWGFKLIFDKITWTEFCKLYINELIPYRDKMNKKANELLNTTKRNTFARYVYLQNKIDMHIAEIALMSEKGEGFKNPTVQDMLDKLADARKRVEWKK